MNHTHSSVPALSDGVGTGRKNRKVISARLDRLAKVMPNAADDAARTAETERALAMPFETERALAMPFDEFMWWKAGPLVSGSKTGPTVTSRKQAVAKRQATGKPEHRSTGFHQHGK